MRRYQAYRCALRTLAVAVILVAFNIRPVPAATSNWTTDTGGDFSNPANWDNGVPGPADTAVFRRLGADYTVIFTGDVSTAKLRVGTNTVTLRPSSDGGKYRVTNPSTFPTNPSIIIGELAGDIATVNGYLPNLSAVTVNLGEATGSVGTLNVLAGSFNVTSGTGITPLIGNSGAGTINVSNGAVVSSIQTAVLGNSLGSQGTVAIRGLGSTWNGPMAVGGAGEGHLNISNGGLWNGGVTTLGFQTSSTGILSIDGPGSLANVSVMSVGVLGNGFLSITNGGQLKSQRGEIGTDLHYPSTSTASVVVDGQGSMWLNDFGALNVGGSLAKALLNITNGGYVSSYGGSVRSSGTVLIDGLGSTWNAEGFLGELVMNGALSIRNGGVARCTSLAIDVGSVMVDGIGSQLTVQDKLSVGTGHGHVATLTISNGAQVKIESRYLDITSPVSIDGPASQLSIAGGVIVAGGAFSISNGAHVTSSKATVQENGIGDVTMSGAGSSWIISGNMDINGPLKLSVTDNAQLVAANWRILQNSLQAVGSITGNMEVGFFGALAPGAPIGELAIVGNYFDHISSKLQIELGGRNAQSEFDRLSVSGDVSLAGTLQISLINGFTPTLGDSFDILDWGTLSGTFSTLQLPALGNNLAWDTSQLYTSGVISVTTVPEPGAAALFAMAAPVLLAGSMRRRNSPNSKRTH